MRTGLEWLVLFFGSIALTIALCLIGTPRLDGLFYDALNRIAPAPADDDVVIVTLGDGDVSDDDAGSEPWMWSRAKHAQLLERIAASRPRAVIYDMMLIDAVRDAASDARLARAATRQPTFFSIALKPATADGEPPHERKLPAAIADMATGTGHMLVQPDPDGVTRRVDLAVHAGGKCWPHLAAAVVARTHGLPDVCASSPHEVLIPFVGPPARFPTIFADTLLQGKVAPARLSGRYVLIGIDPPIGGGYATPMQDFSNPMTGVELHANILESLLHERTREEATMSARLIFALVPILILWAGFLLRGPRTNLILAASIVLAWFLASGTLLVMGGVWLSPAPVYLVMALLVPLWGWRRLAVTSDYLIVELSRLRSERGVGGLPDPPVTGDRIAMQIGLLSAAITRMRASEQQRDDMLNFLSHDMRQPQISILALVERGKNGLSQAESQRIAQHARRTLALADNFVQLAHAESAHQLREVVDLRDILADAVDRMWDQAQVRQTWITIDLPDAEACIHGDPGLLARAFSNLIDNAIKYGPFGGRVDVELRIDGNQALISVSDEGPGVANERVARLFERFNRAGRRDGDGTGLGLVLVRTIAEAHGGSAAYAPATDAPDGTGASFIIRLPLNATAIG